MSQPTRQRLGPDFSRLDSLSSALASGVAGRPGEVAGLIKHPVDGCKRLPAAVLLPLHEGCVVGSGQLSSLSREAIDSAVALAHRAPLPPWPCAAAASIRHAETAPPLPSHSPPCTSHRVRHAMTIDSLQIARVPGESDGFCDKPWGPMANPNRAPADRACRRRRGLAAEGPRLCSEEVLGAQPATRATAPAPSRPRPSSPRLAAWGRCATIPQLPSENPGAPSHSSGETVRMSMRFQGDVAASQGCKQHCEIVGQTIQA